MARFAHILTNVVPEISERVEPSQTSSSVFLFPVPNCTKEKETTESCGDDQKYVFGTNSKSKPSVAVLHSLM